MSAPLEPVARVGVLQQALGGWLGAVSARERRTLTIGAAVLALALLLAYAVLPFARRWSAREALIDARVARLARVRGLVASESALAEAVRAREARLSGGAQRPLTARTPALAAAALQTALQSAALASGVQLQRVDVAEQDPAADEAASGEGGEGGEGLPSVPATLVALGDVHGLAALLAALRDGPTLLEVTAFGAQAQPGPRGEALLQLTVRVRAPWSATWSAP